MHDTDRNDLTERALAGDADALQRVLVLWHDRLRRVIATATVEALRPRIDPDDVLQEAYVAAFVGPDQRAFDGAGHLYKWLEQVALNKLRDAQRALRRKKRDVAREAARQPAPASTFADRIQHLADRGASPSRVNRQNEMTAAVMTSLARLVKDQREVIRLRFFENTPVPEIARRLGKSEAAVYGLYTRGLKRLQELLGPVTKFLTDL